MVFSFCPANNFHSSSLSPATRKIVLCAINPCYCYGRLWNEGSIHGKSGFRQKSYTGWTDSALAFLYLKAILVSSCTLKVFPRWGLTFRDYLTCCGLLSKSHDFFFLDTCLISSSNVFHHIFWQKRLKHEWFIVLVCSIMFTVKYITDVNVIYNLIQFFFFLGSCNQYEITILKFEYFLLSWI